MKKTFRVASIILLVTSLFVACKAALGIPTLGNKPKVLKPEQVLVKVDVKDDSFPHYRTIVPGEWDDTKKGTLKYTIHVNDKNGDVFKGVENIEWDKLKKDYYVDVEDGEYTLVLVGKDDSGKIALLSEPTKITVPGASMLNFVLRPYRKDGTEANAASKGKVNIKFIFFDPEENGYTNVNNVKIRLDVSNTAGNVGGLINPENLTPQVYNNTSGTSRLMYVDYNKDDVTPGVYEFVAELYKGDDVYATARDLVIVDPANTSEKTIKIDYDLKTKPLAPSNLSVKYERPGDTDSTYKVNFSWQDNSYNEDSFVLEILDEKGATLPTQPTIKPSPIKANVTEVSVEGLELSKKYKAKIKAVNTASESDFVEFENHATQNLIHMARITYELDYGSVIANPNDVLTIKADDTKTPPEMAIGYYTQTIDGFMLPGEAGLPGIFRPFDTNGSKDTLYIFKGWYDDNGHGTGDAPIQKIEAKEYAGLKLTAKWETRQGTNITFPTYNDKCYIEGSNMFIDAKVNTSTVLVAKVIPEKDYTIAEAKWFVDGVPATGISSEDTQASPQTSTLTETFSATGFKHVHVLIKLTNGKSADKWVSAYCYVRVQ